LRGLVPAGSEGGGRTDSGALPPAGGLFERIPGADPAERRRLRRNPGSHRGKSDGRNRPDPEIGQATPQALSPGRPGKECGPFCPSAMAPGKPYSHPEYRRSPRGGIRWNLRAGFGLSAQGLDVGSKGVRVFSGATTSFLCGGARFRAIYRVCILQSYLAICITNCDLTRPPPLTSSGLRLRSRDSLPKASRTFNNPFLPVSSHP
jgi:hypothetical protein